MPHSSTLVIYLLDLASKNTENFNSVALHIDCGGIAVLMGADLENSSSDSRVGWGAVVAGNLKSKLQLSSAGIFKVPHHGSSTGHDDAIVSEYLDEDVVAIVTEYSPSELPNQSDIARIKSYCAAGYRTTSKNKDGVKRSKVDAKSISEISTARRVVKKALGHIQIRGKVANELVLSTNDRAMQFK